MCRIAHASMTRRSRADFKFVGHLFIWKHLGEYAHTSPLQFQESEPTLKISESPCGGCPAFFCTKTLRQESTACYPLLAWVKECPTIVLQRIRFVKGVLVLDCPSHLCNCICDIRRGHRHVPPRGHFIWTTYHARLVSSLTCSSLREEFPVWPPAVP